MIPVRSLLLALLAIALLTGGCGGDEKTGASTRLDVPAVVAAAERDETAKTAVTIDVEGLGIAKPLRIQADGTTSLTEVALDLTLDGAPIFERMGISETGTIRLVMLGDRAYLDVPEALRAQIPNGRRWIGVDLGSLAGSGEAGLEAILRLDVVASVAVFEKRPLSPAGEEKLGDQQTTRWRGELSTNDFLATLPPNKRRKVRASLMSGPDGSSERDLAERHPVELWINGDDQVVRAQSTTVFRATKAIPAGKVTMVFDYSDFGGPAPIAAPPSDEAWDATDALTDATAQAAAAGTR